MSRRTEIERWILGTLLNDFDMAELPKVKSILTTDDFSDLRHQNLYEDVLDLEQEGKPPDPMSIIAMRRERGQKVVADEIAFIYELATDYDLVPRIAWENEMRYLQSSHPMLITKDISDYAKALKKINYGRLQDDTTGRTTAGQGN